MKPWMFLSDLRTRSSLSLSFLFSQLRKGLVLGGLLVLTLLVTFNSTVRQRTHTFLLDLTAPLYDICQWPLKQVSSLHQAVGDHWRLMQAYEKLQTENQALRRRHFQAVALAAENERLKDKLRVINEMTPEFISVRVIGGAASPYQRQLLLGGGVRAGIQVKSAVLINHQIIGRISEVGNTSSRVLLITDPLSHVPVILEKSRIQGILSGGQTGTLKIKVVDKPFALSTTAAPSTSGPLVSSHEQSQSVEEGEYVFSSGLGGIFPPGHVVGRVSQVTTDEIIVKSLTDESRLEYVQVAIPYENLTSP